MSFQHLYTNIGYALIQLPEALIYLFDRVKPHSNKIPKPHDSADKKLSRQVYQRPDIKLKVGTSPGTRTTSEDFVISKDYHQALEKINNTMDRMATAQHALTRRMDKLEQKILSRF